MVLRTLKGDLARTQRVSKKKFLNIQKFSEVPTEVPLEVPLEVFLEVFLEVPLEVPLEVLETILKALKGSL